MVQLGKFREKRKPRHVTQAKVPLDKGGRPKYLQVRDLLGEVTSRLSPGKSPTEQQLCEFFGISRSTLRRARAAISEPGHDVRIRVGGPADAEQLAVVFTSAWRHAYPGIVSEEALSRLDRTGIANWMRALAGSRSTTTVVVENEHQQILGFCRFGADPEQSATGHVFSLYVLPEASRQGLGGRLLDYALEDLERRRLGPVTLWVFEENARARRFYSAFGFLPDGHRRVEPDYGAEEIHLRRDAKVTP